MARKKKESTPAGGVELATRGGVDLATERIATVMEIGRLKPAPWNPRRKITPESVADLAASIKSLGLIQPVVAMDVDGESAILIAGHRRIVAAKLAGLKEVRVELYKGLDEVTAKRMTFLENLQRKEADPLLESELVAELLDQGMTQAEIAAETGRGEKWVARRVNLRNLSAGWRERVAKGENITIDCLEHVAAYPESIQEALKDAMAGYYDVDNDATLTWSDIKWDFWRESRNLREVIFDTDKCLKCPNNTGCCPDLFDDDGGKLGKCLDAKCFAARTEEAVDNAVAKAKKHGREVVKGKQPYQCGVYGDLTRRPTKKNTALYVYTDCNGNSVLAYAAPPQQKDEDAKRRAEKEQRKRDRLVDAARDEAREKFGEWLDEREKDGSWPKWLVDLAIKGLLEWQGDSDVDQWARETGFAASDPEKDAAYKEFLAKGAEQSSAVSSGEEEDAPTPADGGGLATAPEEEEI